jgi:precorrin-2 dehydrogenase/sirohydrochlorin ferrochelatase
MLYSMNLDLSRRKAVVVGGGKVAERKVFGLLEADARVTVVSPQLTAALLKLAEDGGITWIPRKFSPEYLDGALLIIAATNDRETNHNVKKSAAENQLVTIADDPAHSDFQVPATIKRGKLTIAISTSGASPILAKKIRSQLEHTYDDRYAEYLDFLASCRQEILDSVSDPEQKRQLLTVITEDSYLENENREAKFAKLVRETSAQPQDDFGPSSP